MTKTLAEITASIPQAPLSKQEAIAISHAAVRLDEAGNPLPPGAKDGQLAIEMNTLFNILSARRPNVATACNKADIVALGVGGVTQSFSDLDALNTATGDTFFNGWQGRATQTRYYTLDESKLDAAKEHLINPAVARAILAEKTAYRMHVVNHAWGEQNPTAPQFVETDVVKVELLSDRGLLGDNGLYDFGHRSSREGGETAFYNGMRTVLGDKDGTLVRTRRGGMRGEYRHLDLDVGALRRIAGIEQAKGAAYAIA